MLLLVDRIDALGLTQSQAAKRLGVTQPRISNLKRGHVQLFTMDALVSMLAKLGGAIRLTISDNE